MEFIKTTVFITLITRIDMILNIVNNSTQLISKSNLTQSQDLINTNPTAYWIIQFAITLVIFCVVYSIFKKLSDLKDDLKMQAIISKVRNVYAFNEQYKNHEFYLLPNETMEEFNNRSLPGIYGEKIKNEVRAVYNECCKEFKNKSVAEIEKLVRKNYRK